MKNRPLLSILLAILVVSLFWLATPQQESATGGYQGYGYSEAEEMKNNHGKGLYEIGECGYLPCGCIIQAEEIGYTHYVDPNCELDNKTHPLIKDYRYKMKEPK